MEVGERIKKLREKKNLSTNDLSRLTGISQSTISKLENGKRKPELSTLEKIAQALNVFVDKLRGESISCIIEDRLEETGKTFEDVAEKTGVPFYWLQNIDTFIPGQLGDYEIGYDWITKVAEDLGLPGSTLRTALARQEIPVYDGPMPTVEEVFKDVSFEENISDSRSNAPLKPLTKKDERDIARDLEKILSNLESDNALSYMGEPLDDETKELMRISLENSMRLATQLAKRKFTPKKYQ